MVERQAVTLDDGRTVFRVDVDVRDADRNIVEVAIALFNDQGHSARAFVTEKSLASIIEMLQDVAGRLASERGESSAKAMAT